ncbi:MAG: bacillithiol biosynthesis cysteine-adding enzyme BshC [Acidobacteriia bacterium]|nr:bacillithiol biosynthesis cysteine-adding enzyme BshC [Terriglobia bacterium]
MECHRIPAGDLPGATLLYTTFLNNFSRVSGFYSHPPNWTGIQQAAAEIRMDDSMRRGVAEVLRAQNRALGGDERTDHNLDRLRDGAVAVVTGQQVGLFGGPAYCVYKALTAIRAARELTAKGTNAVPVFWLATEDHDLAEVNHNYFSKRGGAERFDLAPEGIPDRRVGEIQFGDALRELSTRAAQMLEGPSSEEVQRWLAESYTPQETFGSAFGKLMTRIFAGQGLIFLDPLSPDLHRFSAPTMLRAIREHKILAQELVARSAALEHAGYHAQVKVTEYSMLVFRIVDGQRLALRPSDGGFVAGKKQESEEATLRALELHPEEFSPSALLRPVIQDTLLPTVAYVGGAAEIVYQAQTSVVYQRLLGRAPAILPRAGFTLVPAHVANLLKKYNLQIEDVFAGRHRLHAKMESEALPRALTARFEQGEKSIKDMLDGLREPLTKLDQTLIGALDTASEKMLYQFNGLRSKAGRAEGFRSGVLNTHENEIAAALLPNNALQERSLSLLPFLANEGRELLDRLDRLIKIGTGEHCVVDL